MAGEINCRNCEAACCKGPRSMELTPEEAAQLREAGTNLWRSEGVPSGHDLKEIYPLKVDLSKGIVYLGEIEEGRPRATTAARYILLGECGNLRTDPQGWQYCGAYEQRPQDCRDLVVAETKCRVIRLFQDVDRMDAPNDVLGDLRDMLD